MGCFRRNWRVLSCIFVWSVAILRTTDGGSITWYEPPPFETITDATITSFTHKNLTKGFINEELSCNFSLTADLSIITVTISFGGDNPATYVRSPPELTVDGRFESRLNATWIPTKLTLIVFNVTTDDEGEYRCSVLTSGGGVKTWTRAIQVAVLVSPSVMVSKNQTVTKGDNVSLICTAEGKPPPRTTWIRLSNNSVVSGNFTSISKEDAGGYRCTADNGVGSPVSKDVFIDVQCPPEGIKFHVSEEEVCNGTTISFSCSAEIANPMELDYQLYENNVMIGGISSTGVWNKTMTVGGVFVYKCMVNNSVGTAMSSTVSVTVNVSSSIQTIPDKVFREDDNVTLFCNVSGIPQPLISWINVSNDQRTHGNELTIESITRYQAGEYRCEATNPCRNATKSTAIDVHYPPEGIQFHVSEEDVCNGTTISFNCSAETANPMELNYQLYENNMMIGVISSTGVWNKTMTVGGVFVYKCVVNNSVGTAMSSTVSVNVNVSSFIMPISEEVTEGGNLTLSCHATGIPPPTVFWVNTSNGERTNGTELFIRNIRRSEAGEYRCEVTNPCGNAAESPTIDVQYPPEGIQLHVSEGEVCNGTTISFNCSAETANPMEVNYQLYENNVMIGVISSTGVWSKTMTVGGVFVYKCMVNNSVGTAMSSTVSVTVNVSSSIQTIPDKVVREGGNVTLFCNASGIPQPLVYWINVSNDQRTHGNELAIENITRYEAGEYRCEATNPCRNATKSTTIVVHYAAEATGKGGNYSVPEGFKVLFSCPVDGNPEPNITWYKDNEVIEPEILHAKQLEAGETGCYTCSAINGLGPPVTITQCLIVGGNCETNCTDGKECLALGTKYFCYCPNGTTGDNCLEKDTLTNEVGVRLVLPNEEFKREYEDPEDPETKKFKEKVTQGFKIDMNGTGLENVTCRNLSNGSVIADVELTFSRSVGKGTLKELIIEVLKDGKLGEIDVGGFTIDGFISVTEEPSLAMPSSTIPRQPIQEGPPWTIIGAVAGSVVLVALVVAFVTWWVHKKRKCIKDTKIHNSECEESLHGYSPHASVNRAYAESGPPSANGSKGAAQEQSQDPGAIPTYAVVDKSKKKKKAEEKPPIYATVDKSKKRKKKKTDDKNLYDSVEEPKKEKKPGEVTYAELGDFQKPAMPKVSTSPETLPPLKRAPSYEQTQYADITAFLKGDATLPQKEGNEGSEMQQQQSANQSQHDVDNKETPIQENNGAYAKSGPPSANSTDVSSAAQKQPAQEAGAVPTYAVVDKSKKKKKEPDEMPLVNTDMGKSKKKKKKMDDKNLYDSVEEPKKEKKPGEIFYADLGEFQKQEMPKVATSPPTLPPLKRAPSYEKTDYAEITQFLKKEATLPREKTSNSEMKPQAANQTHDEVENKETPL